MNSTPMKDVEFICDSHGQTFLSTLYIHTVIPLGAVSNYVQILRDSRSTHLQQFLLQTRPVAGVLQKEKTEKLIETTV